MNWLKHIFIKNQTIDTSESFKKEMFQRLSLFSRNELEFSFKKLGGREEGLETTEAKERIKIFGYNNIADEKRANHFLKLFKIARDPLNLLLLALAIVSLLIGDMKAASVIFLMVWNQETFL